MNQIDRAIKGIMGTPKKRGGKNDWDGDGVYNKNDCQPRNVMRQDDTISDYYGTKMRKGDYLVDENGNVGRIVWVKADRALVNFGKEIGQDMVYDGDRVKKGRRW